MMLFFYVSLKIYLKFNREKVQKRQKYGPTQLEKVDIFS